MSIRRDLFCSSAFGATLGAALLGSAAPGLAQSVAAAQPSGAPSATADSASTKNPEEILQEVVVTAAKRITGGLMKEQTAPETMSSITPSAIAEKVSAASPLQLVATIPGVNFGTSDAYGLTVRDFLSVRGLDQSELGFLIENVPGTDLVSYFPYSEAWADNENISDITLTPGNSRLQDPIISASGGEFIESIRAPQDTFGGMASQSAGSYGAWRSFVDIDTGYLGQTGAKAFLSYSYTSAGTYVGPGVNSRNHVDFKVTEDWSERAHSSLFASYNHLVNARLPPLSLAQVDKAESTDNFGQFAYAPAYVPGVTTNYYRPNVTYRTNYLVASNNDLELTDRVTVHVTPYYKYTGSDAPGEVALSPTSIYAGNQLVTPAFNPASLQNGKLFAQNNVNFFENQSGVSTYLEANFTPSNHLMLGYWHENWRMDYGSVYNLLDENGNPSGISESTALKTTSGALITGTNFRATTNTDQAFIGDTQSMLDDKLRISIGFKELFYSVGGQNEVIGASPNISARWSEPMPRFLVSYDLNSSMQLYANITTNSRMPNVAATYVTQFSVSTGHFSSVANTGTEPEYSTGEQIGYRYHGLFNVDVNAFYMSLRNHQVSSLEYINGSLVNTAISAGGETIRGVSLETSTNTYHGFSVYGSAQYLYGTFDDNVPVGADYLPTHGKQMVESPNWIASIGGRYENGPFFASVTEKYVGSQFSTFMNDQRMPSYNTVDLALGYRLPDYKALSKPVIRLNLTNLADKSYISSVASVTTNAVATHGVNGTAIAGGTPLYYIGAPLAVMLTLSSNF
jgi:iron complex outermembrane recepter protein